jgi:hypothetical protein
MSGSMAWSPDARQDSNSGSSHRPKRSAEVLSQPTETRREGTGRMDPCVTVQNFASAIGKPLGTRQR